ncbi:MAG: oxidoreductase, partial [Massilibacteroides sp.]|nr:oxidoreductase [Massilibacteroides sp.]
MKYNGIGCLIMASMVSFSCTTKPAQESTSSQKFTGASGEVKLITLAPGHFHAALVQKSAYDQVSNDVFVYAPKGAELDAHLKLVNGFNTRATT